MKMQLQILFQVYFCTDAVLLQYLISFNLLPSDMASVAALYVNSFRDVLLFALVFSKSATIRNNIVENPSFLPDLQAMLSTVHKL